MSSIKPDNLIAIIDCNNFYVSCERIFNPKLFNKPTVVLSNNDGCVIARSQEVKELGIPMGIPIFKIQHLVEIHDIQVYSSNFSLYGDISRRIMQIIQAENPSVELYSIDEAFITLNPRYRDVESYCEDLKKRILQWTGIPVSIGVGKTKTLAKIANHLAKKLYPDKGVCILDEINTEELLQRVKVEDIWGVGRQKTKFLKLNGIFSALDLKRANPFWVQKHMTIISRHTVDELNGIPKIELEDDFVSKKTISTSRSFRKNISSLSVLENAVSSHAARAAEKLRTQKGYITSLGVYVSTNRFRDDLPQYRQFITVNFPLAINDTAGIIQAAIQGLHAIFIPELEYKKCGVILNNIIRDNQVQESLFHSRRNKEELLSSSIDTINKAYGLNTIKYAIQGSPESWSIKREKLSQSYTTNWNDLLSINLEP
jgi:DNA polymerase V